MSKKSELPQTRRHLMIYDEDWEWFQKHFGPGSHGAGLGISGAVKQILHQRVQGMKSLENRAIDQLADGGFENGK